MQRVKCAMDSCLKPEKGLNKIYYLLCYFITWGGKTKLNFSSGVHERERKDSIKMVSHWILTYITDYFLVDKTFWWCLNNNTLKKETTKNISCALNKNSKQLCLVERYSTWFMKWNFIYPFNIRENIILS